MTNFYFKPLKSEKLQSGVCYGQFLINDLQPGQGITIGNHLRRVLLGDLEGAAISAVRIVGIRHEFATIPGVREDILEILLNLKGIVIKSNIRDVKFGRLKVQGPLVVTADLISLPTGLEIINKNHYIATISSSINLEIEFKIEHGTGYKLASQMFVDEDKSFLQIDSIFMPIQKVNFKIENVYDNENSITERLFIEIWTNGSIKPIEALKKACQIIINLFTSLIETKNTHEIVEPKINNNLLTIEPYTNIAIEELQLSVRAYNCLKKAKINTVGDLLQYTPEQLQELKNFGRKSADEVFSTLKNKLNIILKKDIQND
jgi:DNA-directed RNA polymerase subunit alpha